MKSFPKTQWSTLAQAFPPAPQLPCGQALNDFCRVYWQALHQTLVRKHGYAHAEAEDLTQTFLLWLLDGDHAARANPSEGKFRDWLVALLGRYVSNQRRIQGAKCRWGHAPHLSLADAADAAKRTDMPGASVMAEAVPEAAAMRVAAETMTPDQEIQRAWALATLGEARDRLQRQYAARGKERLFALLLPFLSIRADAADTAGAVAELGISPAALRMARSGFRREFGQAIRDLVRATVRTEEEFEEEMALIRQVAG